MSYETDTAAHYRKRATHLRAIASNSHDPQTTRTVERLAHEYDQMAHIFDGIDEAGLAGLRARISN
jgi:hypothetical protein